MTLAYGYFIAWSAFVALIAYCLGLDRADRARHRRAAHRAVERHHPVVRPYLHVIETDDTTTTLYDQQEEEGATP